MERPGLDTFVELAGIDASAKASDIRASLERVGVPQPNVLLLLDEALEAHFHREQLFNVHP